MILRIEHQIPGQTCFFDDDQACTTPWIGRAARWDYARIDARMGAQCAMPRSLLSEDEQSVRMALDASPIYQIRQLQVQRTTEAIQLNGRVDSYYLKQIAQETVFESCPGVRLINSITVSHDDEPNWYDDGPAGPRQPR